MADLSAVVHGRQWPPSPLGEGAPLSYYQSLPLITNKTWDSLTSDSWYYYKITADNDAVIAVDNASPYSPGDIVAIDFTGCDADGEPVRLERQVGGIGLGIYPREIYHESWFKLSSSWETSPAGAGKFTFLWPDGAYDAYLGIYCMGASCDSVPNDSPFRIAGQLQWPPYAGFAIYPNVYTSTMVRNQWYKVASYYKFETVQESSGDGIWRVWVDDVLNIEYTDLTYPLAMGTYWTWNTYAPTRQNAVVNPQYLYIDHTIIRAQ